MFNYIKSELFRTFHRRYFRVMLGVGAGCALLVNIVGRLTLVNIGGNVDASFMFSSMTFAMLFVTYMCVCVVVDCVFGDEYKNLTLRNAVSFGITRTKIYLGKLISEIIVAVIEMLAIYLVYAVGALLIVSSVNAGPVVAGYLLDIAKAFPIWLAGLAIANLLYFSFKGAMAPILYLGAVALVPMIFNQFAVRAWPVLLPVQPYLMFNMLDDTVKTAANLVNPWLIGLSWAALATLAGVMLFRKKEIK